MNIGRLLRKSGGASVAAAVLVGCVILWLTIPDAEKARNPSTIKLLFYPAVSFLCFVAALVVRLYRWVWPDRVTLTQLVEQARPRSRSVVATAVRLYAVRHQLGRMGLWLLLTVPVAALVLNAYVLDVGVGDPDVSAGQTLARFGLACAIVAPMQLAQFAAYAIRRCWQLARVTRDGEVVPAQVSSVQVEGAIRSQFRLGRRRARIELAVTGVGSDSYAFELPAQDLDDDARWCRAAAPVRAVVTGRDRFAIVLSPQGREYFAHRIRGWRDVIDERRARRALPAARLNRAP